MDTYVIIEWARKGEMKNVYATTDRDEATALYVALNQNGKKSTLWKASVPPVLAYNKSLFSLMEQTPE